MKPRSFLRSLCAVLASAAVFSCFGMGASVSAAVSDTAEEAPSQAAPGNNEIVDKAVPSLRYRISIGDTDDYISAVRATSNDPKEVQNAINAVKNYVPVVDNSKNKYFPPIGNQGNVGSCAAWANVYYNFTYHVNKMLDRKATKENSFNPLFIYNLLNGGKSQGTDMESYYAMLNTIGCADFSTVAESEEFRTWHPQYETWLAANKYRVSSYFTFEHIGRKNTYITSVDDPDIAAIKAILRNGDILAFDGFIYSYVFDTLKACSSDPSVNKGKVGKDVMIKMVNHDGGHAMSIVGYDDTVWTDLNNNDKIDNGEMGALIVANSWGGWKNDGFFYMAYDALNARSSVKGVVNETNRFHCIKEIYKINVDKSNMPSNIYLKYTFNTSDRYDVYAEVKATRKTDGAVFTRKTVPFFLHNQIGQQSINYIGTNTAVDGSFIFDLDNVVKGIDSNTFHDYKWSVSFVDRGKDQNPLIVKEALIVDDNTAKTYQFDMTNNLQVTGTTKTVSLKKYYNFNKLSYSPKTNVIVGQDVKIAVYAENETRSSDPIKYSIKIKNGKELVFSKAFKATTVDAKNKTASASVKWKPEKTGTYTVIVRSTDASGAQAYRTTTIKVYPEKLAVRSIDFDKGSYVGKYETVKITPKVTGGEGPFTYSYYLEKGGKTYKIAENTKSAYKTKEFSTGTGVYKITVKVKDSKGNVATLSKNITVYRPVIESFSYSYDFAKPGNRISVNAKLKNTCSGMDDTNVEYTVSINGAIMRLTERNEEGKIIWIPQSDGKYTITATLKYKGIVLDTKSDVYTIGDVQDDDQDDDNKETRRIIVNVLSDICNYSNDSLFTVHYWGGKDGAKDEKCVSMNKTILHYVGYWSSDQSFRQYYADIPADATGWKFHIGTRWFGGDASAASYNGAYIFNYNGDKATYYKS